MKSFIEEVIEALPPEQEWKNTTIIFPNRRAGLFFRNELAKFLSDKPVFSPKVISLEDFIFGVTPVQMGDNLTLISDLFKAYKKVFPQPEPFADFFFWGKMILRDFDDIDQNLGDARAIYSIVEEQKQMDLSLAFLTEDQVKLIASFWSKFTKDRTPQKDSFLNVWKKLYPLYQEFQKICRDKKKAYKGFAYRYFLKNPSQFNLGDDDFVFAGFNAFTKAEEEIITWFLKSKKTRLVWDLDAYYIKDSRQEAGRSLRKNIRKSIFQNTFPKELPDAIRSGHKDVQVVGVPFRAGQAKYVGQELEKLLEANPYLPLHKIAIVLPDEQLLFSVLNALPPQVTKFNVTMGFPVETTPLFSLLLHCINLQDYIKNENPKIYYRAAFKILQHPLMAEICGTAAVKFVEEVQQRNKVYVALEDIRSLHPSLKHIFISSEDNFTTYLINILQALLTYEDHMDAENNTAINFVIRQLLELQEFEKELDLQHDRKNFNRFLRQLLTSEKIPFEGEPLQGLQIMGVLETRNLDFEHVFILSLNEEFFPADSRQKSFIPYNIRKAFDLPVFDQQDAIYAYLFYRLFQRSKTVTCLYNTEGNAIGGQEMSRFLQQIIHEQPFPIKHNLLNTPVKTGKTADIIINKDQQIINILNEFLIEKDMSAKRWFYPSTLYTYLNCRLQFYFKYVARIREADEMDDEVDARLFGNILHNTMESLYENYKQKTVEKKDIKLLRKKILPVITQEFKKEFGVAEDGDFEFTGNNIIQRQMLIKFINRILDQDEKIVPFTITALETDNADGFQIGLPITIDGDTREVGLKAKIDRLDEHNGNIRVIDYKTGKDDFNFRTIDGLFVRDEKTNKAAFQTLFYSHVYSAKEKPHQPVTPGLYSRTNVFSEDFDYRLYMNKRPISNYNEVIDEYEKQLKILLEELFDPTIPFDQTTDLNKCSFCSFAGICKR